MERTPSISQQRLQKGVEAFHARYPNYQTMQRDELVRAIESMCGNDEPIRIEGALLREVLGLREDYGAVIHAKRLTNNPAGTHYDYCFAHLLRSLETGKDMQLNPELHKLVESTSGSAGISFAWIAAQMGYQREVIIPDTTEPVTMRCVEEAVGAEHLVKADSSMGYILGLQRRLMRRLVEIKRDESELKPWCPDHSRSEETPRAFSSIATALNKQLLEGHLDASVFAIGNGTTVYGIAPELKRHHPDMRVIGFQDAAQKKGETVTLRGAGGRNGVDFPFVDKVTGGVLTEPVHSLQPQDWKPTFERFNTGKQAEETIGRTSAAALAVAGKMIEEQRKAMDILVFFYDHAYRYGNKLVTRADDVYEGDGNWRYAKTIDA